MYVCVYVYVYVHMYVYAYMHIYIRMYVYVYVYVHVRVPQYVHVHTCFTCANPNPPPSSEVRKAEFESLLSTLRADLSRVLSLNESLEADVRGLRAYKDRTSVEMERMLREREAEAG